MRNNPKAPGLLEKQVDGLTNRLFDGLLSQLRSVPVGMRVDAWILANYPELAALQRKAVMKQLDDAAAALRPEVPGIMPDEALEASLAMSAAFSIFRAEKFGQPQITLP